MKETFKIAEEVAKTVGGDGFNNYKVRARLAIMEKKFKEAEGIYLEQVGGWGHKCRWIIQLVYCNFEQFLSQNDFKGKSFKHNC